MPLDLTPLEEAAGRAGLPGLRARVVPPDRRRGTWFAWGGGELCVSEHVVDRCPPPEASALLVQTILFERRMTRVRHATRAWAAGALAAATALALLGPGGARQPEVWIVLVLGLVSAAVLAVTLRARAALAADDEAVARLGGAEELVRGLNAMDRDELRLAGRRVKARPDLHRRAERLVRRHRLCGSETADGGP